MGRWTVVMRESQWMQWLMRQQLMSENIATLHNFIASLLCFNRLLNVGFRFSLSTLWIANIVTLLCTWITLHSFYRNCNFPRVQLHFVFSLGSFEQCCVLTDYMAQAVTRSWCEIEVTQGTLSSHPHASRVALLLVFVELVVCSIVKWTQ